MEAQMKTWLKNKKQQILSLTESKSIIDTVNGKVTRFSKDSGILNFWQSSEDEYITGDLKNSPVAIRKNEIVKILKAI